MSSYLNSVVRLNMRKRVTFRLLKVVKVSDIVTQRVVLLIQLKQPALSKTLLQNTNFDS